MTSTWRKTFPGFRSCKEKLDGYYSRIEQIDGISVSSASILKEMSTLLDGLIKHPGKIAKRLETFRSDISTMATWAIDMQEQPLVMDKFFVYSPDVSTPRVGSNFFAQLWYRLMLFFHSFAMSTTSISGSSEVDAGDTGVVDLSEKFAHISATLVPHPCLGEKTAAASCLEDTD